MRVEQTSTKQRDTKNADDGTKLADALGHQHEKEVHDEILLTRERDKFDFETEEKSELEREYNTIRDMMLEQMKLDDEALKKYIAMI